MDLDKIVTELEEERDRVGRAIDLLKGISSSGIARKASARISNRQRRGGMTPAGRKRLSQLMKKRWAERRKKRA